MDPLVITNPSDKEFNVPTINTSSIDPDPDADVQVSVVSSQGINNIPIVVIDSISDDNDLTVTPAFPNFSTDEEIVIEPNAVVLLESTKDISEEEKNSNLSPTTPAVRPSQQSLQLLDELKYLLKPTNSLSNADTTVQASQEADSAIKRRTMQFDDDFINNTDRLLIEGLTPQEIKSLNAAERRSIASRGQRLSNAGLVSNRSRANTMQPETHTRTYSIQPTTHTRAYSMQPATNTRSSSIKPATMVIGQPEHRTISQHLSGLFWAFVAAYAFSIIIFLTKLFEIDLIFGFFLQMIVQTIAFGVYAFYKGYNLLGPSEHRIAMILRALLISIGVLTSFLAYYYITLPDLSAIRQSQVILTIVLSIFVLHERITISRIIACILTIIAIVILIRPTAIGILSSTEILNSTNNKTYWIPYSTSWNHIIGISFALCTVICYSIASIMNKIYFTTEHLYYTVLCFWSALFALIISIILVFLTHFSIENRQSFPHDWRLFVAIGLGLVSIFVFIANQKAIKRERSSVVTFIYATDVILALILQNIFKTIKSDLVVILGCVLILVSVFIICIEVLLMENRKKKLAIKVARITNMTEQDTNNLPKTSILKTTQKRLSF